MKWGGIQRFSTIDYPGHLAAVLFTVGCNFRCPFCHNSELVTGEISVVSGSEILNFLTSRKGQLDGIVISGGEPTLHLDCKDWMAKIKSMGFDLKLDTNGTNPALLEQVISENLVDYIAMDIKHIWDRYHFATGSCVDVTKIQQSVKLLLKGDVDYEFRTTVIQDFHMLKDIVKISEQLKGAKKYVVQEFIPHKTLDSSFSKKIAFSKEDIEQLSPLILKNIESFQIRA